MSGPRRSLRSGSRLRTARSGGARRTGARSQVGATLIELLIGIVLTSMIMVPLAAWGSLVLRTQPITQDQMMRTVRSGLISAYLPDDISSASAADDFPSTQSVPDDHWWNKWDRSDCVGGGGSGPGARPLLILLTGGLDESKVIYSVAHSSEDPSEWSIWRRQCKAVGGAHAESSTELFERVEPGLTRTFATCFSPVGELPCRQIELKVTPKGQTKPVVLSAMRRTDAEARFFVDDGTAEGNHVPSARITVASITPIDPDVQAVDVQLDASQSADPDGSIVKYSWKLPSAPVDENPTHTTVSGVDKIEESVILPRAGVYSIELTVTDNGGATTTTYKRVEVPNKSPIAVGSATPATGRAGIDPFTLSGAESSDPDGSIVSYTWTITGVVADGSQVTITRTERNPSDVILPTSWLNGPVSVMLTVVDNDLASDIFVTTITLSGGTPPPTTVPPDGSTTTTEPPPTTTTIAGTTTTTSSTTTTTTIAGTTTTTIEGTP